MLALGGEKRDGEIQREEGNGDVVSVKNDKAGHPLGSASNRERIRGGERIILKGGENEQGKSLQYLNTIISGWNPLNPISGKGKSKLELLEATGKA